MGTVQTSLRAVAAIALFSAGSLSLARAHPHDNAEDAASHDSGYVHENGIGPDPDGDTNPATITGVFSVSGDAALAADDPPYSVITFEPPPGKQGEAIKLDYKEKHGVTFGKGLSWQACEGQRHFRYDSMCTYEAAPSGRFAAGYLSHINAPLKITFDKPVCVVTLAIYPTGGKEDESFTFAISGETADGRAIKKESFDLDWTKYTVRWRHMAGAFFLGEQAKTIYVSMKSNDPVLAGDTLRYLIDDFAFVSDKCDAALDEISERTGVDLPDGDAPPAGEPTVPAPTTATPADENAAVEGS